MAKFILSLMLVLGFTTSAFGVSKSSRPNGKINLAKSHAWVTTRIAEIAHSDVQVRQLIKLFSNKKMTSENYFQQLQKLQSRNK